MKGKDKNLTDILNRSFAMSEKRKEAVAHDLCVERRTIDNWLNGKSVPNATQFLQWFVSLGLNPVPYLYEYYYPSVNRLKPEHSDADVIRAFNDVSKSLTIRQMRIIMVACKKNGSDIECLWELFLTYMQNNIRNKILIATDVVTCYEIEGASYPENIQPNIPKIKLAIEKAKEAYKNGHKSYVLIERK